MSEDLVKRICNEWIADGRADECFWEAWPECPTEDTLTPRMVIDRIEALEAALLAARLSKARLLVAKVKDHTTQNDKAIAWAFERAYEALDAFRAAMEDKQ